MNARQSRIQARLRQWGRWVQMPRLQTGGVPSPAGKLVHDRNAAGFHGDGIRYEIVDGVCCPPDGGMSRTVEQRGRELAHDIRCRETHSAIGHLPKRAREAIELTYMVAPRESRRSAASVAALMGISINTVRSYLYASYDALSDRIYGPFDFAEEAEVELLEAA